MAEASKAAMAAADKPKDVPDIIPPEDDGPPAPATKDDLDMINAAEYGREKEVTTLLAKGANIKARAKRGETALHLAARYGHKTTIELLLEAHAIIDAQDDDGWTALYGASSVGYAEIVQLLIDRGASISLAANDGWTAIHEAGHKGHTEVVKILLANNADLGYKTSFGETPLHAAVRLGFKDAAELMLEAGASLAALDKAGWTPLYSSCTSGKKEVVQILLDRNADVNVQAGDGWTALHEAGHKGHLEVVQLLLEYKADLQIKTSFGETPLHAAGRLGQKAVIPVLLDAGAAIEALDNAGWTALYTSSNSGHKDVVQILLDHNADVHLHAKNGWTSLHAACNKGHREVVQLLLKYKADIMARTDKNETTMHLAAKEGHTTVVEQLLGHLDHVGKALALQYAAADGDFLLIQIMINDGYDISKAQKDDEGQTLLSLAAGSKHWDVVWLLLQQMPSADFGGNDEIEEKALIWAAQNDDKMVRLLLRKKATDLKGYSSKITDSWTALHWAAFLGHYLVVYWLLANGTSIAEKDVDGCTALTVAKKMAEIEGKEPQHDNVVDASKRVVEQGKDKRRKSLSGEGKESKKPLTSEEKFSRTLELLRNPPVVQGQQHTGTPYSEPTLRKDSAEGTISKEFNATIIDFYKKSRRVDFLRRTRSVYDVIYKDGPEGIMSVAKENLEGIVKELDPEDVKKKDDEDDDADGNREFRWIHLPANNMNWMEDLLMRVCWDKKKKKKEYQELSKFLRNSSYELPGRSAHSRFMKPACIRDTAAKTKATKTESNSKSKSDKKNEKSTDEECKLALYMPYLTFGTIPLVATYQSQTHSCHTETDPVTLRHQRLMEVYKEKPVHGSQTLDQFYYHSLANTDLRDRDQVVTRYIEGTRNKNLWGSELTVLRVDQLWLWVVDEKTIITSSTHRQDEIEDPVVERIFNYLREEKGKGQGQPPPHSVTDLSRFITNFCVGFIDQYTTKVHDTQESAQQIFARSINEKAAEEAQLFHNFTCKIDEKLPDLGVTMTTGTKYGANKTEAGNHRKDAVQEDKGKPGLYSRKDKNGKKLPPENPYASISIGAHLLEEVKDIRDELNILRSLLRHQKTVWDSLYVESSKEDRRRSPDYAIEEIDDMDQSANQIQDSVNSLLGLDQNEANISEAQETTKQGRTLMVFTIVTIIFLPMSFLATMFTLNVSSFPHDSTGFVRFEPEYIFPILFCTPVAVSIPLVLLAFNAKSVMGLIKRKRKEARALRQMLLEKHTKDERLGTQLNASQEPTTGPIARSTMHSTMSKRTAHSVAVTSNTEKVEFVENATELGDGKQNGMGFWRGSRRNTERGDDAEIV